MAKQFKSFEDMGASFMRTAEAFEEDVKGVVEINTGDMELEAIKNSPGPGQPISTEKGTETQSKIARGRNWTPISQAIGYTIDPTGLRGTVFVEKSAGELAIYVEFGTGQSAKTYLSTVPDEFKAVAARYYINGKGSIVNRPYLLPAYFKYSVLFQKEMKELVKNITFK